MSPPFAFSTGRFLARLLAPAALVFCFSACSGPRDASVETPVHSDDTPALNLADYETFDAASYSDEPPRSVVTVRHDVPEALMLSRADAGVVQVVDGYRVQVFSSLDRNEAVQAEEDVSAWWESLRPSVQARYAPDSTLAVYNNYKQPLYRVRVGDFTRRADAEQLMTLMSSRFATVFVVPDRVTIRR